jgi:hypothetical protein
MRSRAAFAFIAVLCLDAACGGNSNSPNNPTPGSSVPTLSSPPDDAVATGRPSLTVNNVSSGAGARTYDFQVAESEAALAGPVEGLFASATGIAEGAGGRTNYDVPRDLSAGTRYFWRARVVQGGAPGAWSNMFRFRTDFSGNAPPVIQAITVSSRAEASTQLDVSAVAQDQETSPANLIYEWSSTAGSFSGSGASVRWVVPAINTPTAVDLTLTVVERYTVPVAGGGVETRENRVSKTTTVHANDSSREITVLATTFIDDFIHSERSPEFSVRNFSNSCQGKQDELSDIRDNRRLFVIDPAQSSLGTGSIGFYDTGNVARRIAVPPSQAGFAEFLAPCRFTSTRISTGRVEVASGTCRLTTVYEDWQWRLCDSNFLTGSGLTAVWSRLPFGAAIVPNKR